MIGGTMTTATLGASPGNNGDVAFSFCPGCGASVAGGNSHRIEPLSWLHLPAMRYPQWYGWFVILASLDITFTWVILTW